MTKLAVVNASTLVSDNDVKTAWLAVKNQTWYHFCPNWGDRFVDSVFVPKGGAVPEECYPIYVLDSPDVASALGYHTEDPGGKVYGRVFAQPVLSNGGTALSGSLSISAVLSHEVLEAIADLHVNLWADRDAASQVAFEVGDPVESDFYSVHSADASGHTVMVSVSNFVLPAWFDPLAATPGRFDYMNKTAGPFQMSTGGYTVVRDLATGKVTQVFGSKEAEDYHSLTKPAHSSARSVKRILSGT